MPVYKSEIRKMAQEWKDGIFTSPIPSSLLNFQRLPRAWFKNETGNHLKTGQRVFITYTGSGTNSFSMMVAEYAQDGFVLSGSVTASNSAPSGFLLEPIKSGSVGAIYVPGLTAGILTICTTSHRFAKTDGDNLVSTDDPGQAEFFKIANSGSASGNYFCFLAPYVRRGGHLIGQTNGAITGPVATCSVSVANGSQTETYTGVKCPLLRSGESIDKDTLVVISFNQLTGAWEIIEAQCPIETETNSGSES